MPTPMPVAGRRQAEQEKAIAAAFRAARTDRQGVGSDGWGVTRFGVKSRKVAFRSMRGGLRRRSMDFA